MLEKNIEFTLIEEMLEDAAEFPSPSIKNLPEWYKKTSTFIGNNKVCEGKNFNETVKKCIPVFDAMTNGYIIKTWTDVNFRQDGVNWSLTEAEFPAVTGHPIEQIGEYNIPPFYKKEVFKWMNPWKIKTPKGYSCMFVTPVGHDLPFKLIEGIVDTDTFPMTINFPFFLNRGFEGIIPYGTPMVQVIPFKRDSFKAKSTKFNEKDYNKSVSFHHRFFLNRYKINWWSRKDFK